MKTVFTIVSYNYLPLAFTLGDSIKSANPEVSFVIYISDFRNNLLMDTSDYQIFSLDDLAIPDVLDMAFKYDITEFCTSIKPFCILDLFSKGFTDVIYFDPDILVFQNLDIIYDVCSEKDFVVTPHFFSPENTYSGVRPEGLILFSGIYNLGFLAVKDSALSRKFINWWAERLKDQCYVDKFDGLHVDQKWVDFAPAFFADRFYSMNHLGMNMAVWNFHERELVSKDEVFYVRNKINSGTLEPLVFFHFSSFDYYGENMENKLFPSYKEKFPDVVELVYSYRNLIVNRGLFNYNIPYSFSNFDNGAKISLLHRRFYRIITAREGKKYDNPFSSNSDSFFGLLRINQLLANQSKSIDKLNETNYTGFDAKVKLINTLFLFIKFLIGFEKYSILTKFFIRYFRPENQIFLLKQFRENYTFINENRSFIKK